MFSVLLTFNSRTCCISSLSYGIVLSTQTQCWLSILKSNTVPFGIARFLCDSWAFCYKIVTASTNNASRESYAGNLFHFSKVSVNTTQIHYAVMFYPRFFFERHHFRRSSAHTVSLVRCGRPQRSFCQFRRTTWTLLLVVSLLLLQDSGTRFLWTVQLLHLLLHLRPGLRHFSLFRHNPHCSTRLCTMARYMDSYILAPSSCILASI